MFAEPKEKPVNILLLGSYAIYQRLHKTQAELANSTAPLNALDKVIAIEEKFITGESPQKTEYDLQGSDKGMLFLSRFLPSRALFILGENGADIFRDLAESCADSFKKNKPIIFVMDDEKEFQRIKQQYGLEKAERCSVAEANSEYFQEKIKFKQNAEQPVAFDVQESAQQNFGPHRFFKASAGGIMIAGSAVGGALLAKAVLTGTLLLAHLVSGFLTGGAAILILAVFAMGLKMLINNTCKFPTAAIS